MIWIKIKNTTTTKATVYTSNPDLAAQLGMTKRRKGKFWYKIVGSKKMKKVIGLLPKQNSGLYMRMVHTYPPAAAYIRARQKIPLEIKTAMMEYMEWDAASKTYNTEKGWREDV